MRIAIYGLPCSGKTTLIKGINNAKTLSGSQELNRLSNGSFSSLSEEEKNSIRIKYTEFLYSLTDKVIVSDGHYSFIDQVVFTSDDAEVYDVFFYLYCDPKALKERLESSEKNEKYNNLSEETLKQWQLFEMDSLRRACHEHNRDFYIISDNEQTTSFYDFLDKIISGFSTVKDAKAIANRISQMYPYEQYHELYLSDGDKTIIEQDSFRFCYNGKTRVFDGDFYTGYQSYLYNNELAGIISIPDIISDIKLNDTIWQIVSDKPYTVISSGISLVWNRLKEMFGLKEVIADPLISADCKYFVVKFLKELGYSIVAFGDSKNDYYMLKEADCGYMYIGNRISRSLIDTDLSGLHLLYNKTPYFLSDEATEDDQRDISICKSNSGVNGSRLAAAHLRLGQKLGRIMATMYPSNNTAVLVLDRGGRFFGDGIYSSFGGVFYPYNPSSDQFPIITQSRVVIVDSVINTGKSIKAMIARLKESDPTRDIIVVSNVIQQNALTLLSDYKLFVVRSSVNSFVGKRQPSQSGNNGPDTADRLFNIISRSF